ncbi:energy-coupling factor transporter transmembrane component T family protein [Paenibacillus sp. DMB20]|uniref:energy-coupling factor transporter transmembrane component T family protein n=1 Tax=Paenibacillus sp. DMB20 TaxID=1642570 RepID=UPI001364B86F|nr:energy-coupling factor transporter transmembrane component T [Paenibacillus sp. DMB20]
MLVPLGNRITNNNPTLIRREFFAASLNRVGVPYKMAYSVSIALRYIPDLVAEFRSTLHSMEARGMGISKEDGSLAKRLSNLSAVVVPVLQSALHRIDSVTNAMELRGSGTGKKRSWYSGNDMTAADWIVIGLALLALAAGIWLRSRGLRSILVSFRLGYSWFEQAVRSAIIIRIVYRVYP